MAIYQVTAEQKYALDHARKVLAEEKNAAYLPDREWRLQLRHALQDLIEAFEEDR
jgi:hypothetical protein